LPFEDPVAVAGSRVAVQHDTRFFDGRLPPDSA